MVYVYDILVVVFSVCLLFYFGGTGEKILPTLAAFIGFIAAFRILGRVFIDFFSGRHRFRRIVSKLEESLWGGGNDDVPDLTEELNEIIRQRDRKNDGETD